MTTIEEQIWDYIDGYCDADQKLEIARKIASEEAYRSVYQELSALHQQIAALSPEEPSMSFNRNVMNLVNQEIAPVSLKTKVDQRIIYSLAAFFILSIAAVFIYALSQSHFTIPKMSLTINLNHYLTLTPTLIKAFLFLDIIIGFLYLDRLLRRKML